MCKTWSRAEKHYGDGDIDTHPEELPPANTGYQNTYLILLTLEV